MMASPPEHRAAAAQRYFDGRAAVYRQEAERGLWAWQRRREAQALFALAGPVTGRSAIDLGCGAGYYARRLADRGAGPVVAVDASAAMLSAIADPRIETAVGDAATVTLGRRFDLVVVAGVLEFVDDAEAALANARRHMAEGGRIVLLTPPDGIGGRLYRWFHRRHGLAISLFSPARLAALATASGLRLVRMRAVVPYAVVCALEAP